VIPAAALAKEVRALLPACAAMVAALVFASGAPDLLRERLVMLVLVFGSITLGGLAFGHEYSYRTLTLLLAQPVDRRRTCAAKLIVLASAVALVFLAAVLAAPGRPFQMFSGVRGEGRTILILAPICAVCMAPALSVLCRSALAGIVFTVAIPGMLILFANLTATAWYGFLTNDAVNDFVSAFVWRSVSLACAAGAVATWVLFARLEAVEGHAELQWPRWLRAGAEPADMPRKVRGAVDALVRKELRLQQMSFLVVGLFVFAAAVLWALSRINPEYWEVPIEAISMLYGSLLLVLIGSVASAEERQLGTLPSQLLLPVAARTQWAVKAATTLTLALVLGVGVPLLVSSLFSYADGLPWRPRRVKEPLAVAVLLTSCGLYVSSLSSSAVKAMVNSIPVVIAGAVLTGIVAVMVMSIGHRDVAASFGQNIAANAELARSFQANTTRAYLWLAALIAGLLLWFAFINHRSTERRVARALLQALVLIITALCGLAVPLILFTH
jgi:ABC-type transport system involved in multi-copper enzyme maturation permease subunit